MDCLQVDRGTPVTPWVRLAAAFLVLGAAACKGRFEDSEPEPGITPVQLGAEPVGEFGTFEVLLGGHVDQAGINAGRLNFAQVFAFGDAISEARFHGIDGVGADLGGGQRFARIPVTGTGRFTGPNDVSCVACHSLGASNGAGGTGVNVFQDPAMNGAGPFNTRNSPHLLGSAAVQLLAEEMTAALRAQVAAGRPASGTAAVQLSSKGVSFGSVIVDSSGAITDASGLDGVDADLLVKPFGWKGTIATLRGFIADAFVGEMGIQTEEMLEGGLPFDGDDGVSGPALADNIEATVGDVTALTVYIAFQEMPTTLLKLAAGGLIPPLLKDQREAIEAGESLFSQAACSSCHVPSLALSGRVFSEPSRNEAFRLKPVVGGSGLSFLPGRIAGLDYDRPIEGDLSVAGDPPRFPINKAGGIDVPLFGDLRRHDLGAGLTENQVQGGLGKSVFLTENLWGVGSTGPWLHDGRATTLKDAILAHGGEAQASRDAFASMSGVDKNRVLAFLKNLVLFEFPEEESE